MGDKNDDTFAVKSMMNEVDAIIASNLKELSPEDREKSYSDVHGISEGTLSETPLLIASSLSLMQQEIDQMYQKDAYSMAESMSSEYVHNPELRLKFLRGERFCARPAALKLVRHFDLKAHLFGTSKLVKDIEQDDLSDEDIAALYSGYAQWSPLKDSSQRTIGILFPLMSSVQVQVMSRMRASFYLRMLAMEDLDFQRNGTVQIVSTESTDGWFDLDFSGLREGAQRTGQVLEGLPGSTHAVHICFPQNGSFRSFLFSSLVKFAVSMLNPLLKVRVRVHRGETIEDCMKSLQSFGITTSVLPKSPQDNEFQTNLLQSRRNLERNRRSESSADILDFVSEGNLDADMDINFGEWIGGPTRFDVILGRGPRCNLHPGNIRLRKLVDRAKGTYDESRKKEKTEIIAQVVLTIKQKGRFLQESDIGWEEVTDKVAKQKVSHTFRDAGKKLKKQSSQIDTRLEFHISERKTQYVSNLDVEC